MLTEFLANFSLWYWNSLLILRPWSVKFLEINGSESRILTWEVKNGEMMVLWTARGRLQGPSSGPYMPVPKF